MKLREAVGEALRRRRLDQGRTLREVAEAAGVSLTYLSEVERGRKEASSEVLEAVCAALHLALAELFFEVAETLAAAEAAPAPGHRVPAPGAPPPARRAGPGPCAHGPGPGPARLRRPPHRLTAVPTGLRLPGVRNAGFPTAAFAKGHASVRYVEACGLRVSVIGLGAWQFGTPEWGWGAQYGPAEALAVVDRARTLGITLIDTAELYGQGESERLLGRALADPAVRDSVVLASKVTPSWPTRDRVAAAARGSLARLGTDHLDLYQVHWPNPLVPQRSTMAGMRTLQAGGLIRQVGVSNYSLGRWRAAEAALGGPVVSNQVRYSLLTRKPERELLPHAASAGRLVVAFSPLAQGVLAAKYTADTAPGGVRARNLLFSAENLRRAEPVLAALRELAHAHQATPAQVALAWVVHHPGVVAIPGAKSVAQVESNAAAADIALAPDELAHLTAAADGFHRELVGSAGALVGRRLRPDRRPATG